MRGTLLLVSLLAFLDQLWGVDSWSGRPSMPGSPRSISKDNPRLLSAALTFTDSFNNQSNDAFLFKVSAIKTAKQQLVNGIWYFMDLDISRTVCHKRDRNNNLSKCDFQPEGRLHQTFHCSCNVLVIPWLHKTEKVSFHCKP